MDLRGATTVRQPQRALCGMAHGRAHALVAFIEKDVAIIRCTAFPRCENDRRFSAAEPSRRPTESQPMPEGQLLALTEHIYDAGVGGTPWFDVCSSLKALVGARSAALMVGELGTGPEDILYHAEIPLDAAAA